MLTDTDCRTTLYTEGKSRVRLTGGGGLYLDIFNVFQGMLALLGLGGSSD